MGLGSTAKKVQKMVDIAEDLYQKMNDLRSRLVDTQESVEETHERVNAMEAELAEQRDLLEALAREQDLDVTDVIATDDVDDAGDTEDGAVAGAE